MTVVEIAVYPWLLVNVISNVQRTARLPKVCVICCYQPKCPVRIPASGPYGLSGCCPSTPRFSRLLASSTRASHSFKPSTTLRSCRIASNSRAHPSSSFVFNCFQTPSNALGQCSAGVGKHALKLAYELALSVDVSALVKIFCNAAARRPGVDATGA